MPAIQAGTRRKRRETDVTSTIIETIADAEGVPPEDLDGCLYDVVEPEALNRLFQQGDDGPATDGLVSFDFYEYTVTVHSDSTVEIEANSS